MEENKLSSLSQASALEEMGAFWDSHDLTDYDTDVPDVTVSFRRAIAVEQQLFEAIAQEAQLRGVSPETLANLWLQQKLSEEKQRAAA